MKNSRRLFKTCTSALLCACVAVAPIGRALADDEQKWPDCEQTRLVYEQAKANGEQVQPKKIEVDGVSGMFLPMPTARYDLCKSKSFDAMAAGSKIRLLDDRERELMKLETRLETRRAEIANAAKDDLQMALAVAESRVDEAEDELDAWHRSRTLWTVIGIVIAGVLFYGSVVAIDTLRSD